MVHSEEDYRSLQEHLYKQIHDKEAYIRVQAVYALAKLANEQDEVPSIEQMDEEEEKQSIDDGDKSPTRIILEAMRYDTSAYVQATVLISSITTLTYLYFLFRVQRRPPMCPAPAEAHRVYSPLRAQPSSRSRSCHPPSTLPLHATRAAKCRYPHFRTTRIYHQARDKRPRCYCQEGGKGTPRQMGWRRGR